MTSDAQSVLEGVCKVLEMGSRLWSMERKAYPSDLTDATRTVAPGCQAWRKAATVDSGRSSTASNTFYAATFMLPHDFPLADGVPILPQVEERWNVAEGVHEASPSESSRAEGESGLRSSHRQPIQDDGKRGPRGYDAGKKVMGRKRHIVETKLALKGRFPRLRLIWADAGYARAVGRLARAHRA